PGAGMETASLQPDEAPGTGGRAPCPARRRAAEAPASPLRVGSRGSGKPAVMRAGSLLARKHGCGDGPGAERDRRRAGETAAPDELGVGPRLLDSSRKGTHIGV